MLPSGFREDADALRRSMAPRWMIWAWVSATVLTLGVLAATLHGPMDEFVLATGVVRPADYALVFPQASGVVAEVAAHPGEVVKKDEVLARLDSLDLERDLAEVDATLGQAEAERAIAEAQLAATREAPLTPDLLFQAQSSERQEKVLRLRHDLLDRLEVLGQTNNVSVLDLTRERLGVQSAELDLERARQAKTLLTGGYAQAQVAIAEARSKAAAARCAALKGRRELLGRELERRVVRAPADGLVVSRAVRYPGEKVEIGTALFKLAYGVETQLRLYASEDRVNRIKPGMRVRFRPRSDPDRLTPMSIGTVSEVALDRALAKEDSEHPERGSSYAIDVTVERGRVALPLGAAVDAEIVLGERPFWRLLLLKQEATH
jgi:multidrug resistance efflux pump